jgi:hypothetical protein
VPRGNRLGTKGGALASRRPSSAFEQTGLLAVGDVMPGKRVLFDDETWHALDRLAKDPMQDFHELADEVSPICSESTAGQSTSRRHCDRVSARSKSAIIIMSPQGRGSAGVHALLL